MKRKSKPPVTACYTPAVTNACPVVQTAPAVNTTEYAPVTFTPVAAGQVFSDASVFSRRSLFCAILSSISLIPAPTSGENRPFFILRQVLSYRRG